MTEEIRVLIVDDHAVVREGLRALIDTEPARSWRRTPALASWC